MKISYPKEKYPYFQDFRALVAYDALFGDRVLYRYIVNKDEVRELTYRQFSDNVTALASALCALGLKGKKVALAAEPCPEWLQVYIAAICAGAVIVPLDKDLLPEQMAEFANITEAEALFLTSACKKKIGACLANCKAKYTVDINANDFVPHRGGYEDFRTGTRFNFQSLVEYGAHLLAAGYPAVYDLVYDVDAPAAIIYTSGTTGVSKGVMLSQRNILSCSFCAANSTPYTPDDVFLSVLPMHHTYETTIQIAILSIGCTICINNSIKYVMRNLRRFSPTAMVVVPLFVQTIYKRIGDEIKRKGKEKSFAAAVRLTGGLRKIRLDLRRAVFSEILKSLGGRMKNMICGGAPLDSLLVRRFAELGINLYQGYGITECSPLVSVNPYTSARYGSVGPPVKCCTVKILKSLDGVEYPAETGEYGEIAVRGDNVMLGYYKNPDATRAAFTDDGYFRTGDIGYLDGDGYLYITGRKKNLIILSNGENVYPEELEEYLMRLDCVRDCVVLARNNAIDESVITALILPEDSAFGEEPEGGADAVADKIKEEVKKINAALPAFKQIRGIEIRTAEFEKTSSQKIKRHLI